MPRFAKKASFIRWMSQSFVCMIAAFIGSATANAALITSSVTIDLSQTTITSDGSGGQLISGVGSTLVPVNSFTPQVGDILQTTISFANNDRLRIIDGPNLIDSILNGSSGPDFFESLTFYFDGSGFHSSFTTEVTFFDLQGSLSDATPGGSSTGVLAQSLRPDFTDSWISFTGLTLTTTITTLPAGTAIYDRFGLFGGRAGGFEVISGSASAAPEPTSLALFGIGSLGLLGFARRRRHVVRRD